MKSKLGSFATRAVLAGVIAGSGILAASAWATSGGPGTDASRCTQKVEAAWQAKRSAHLANLKEKLALAPTQEAAWNAFAASSQSGAREKGMARAARRDAFASMNTLERLDRMQALAQARQARMAARAEAIRTFYVQLTPAQQAVFDTEAMPRHRHGRPGSMS